MLNRIIHNKNFYSIHNTSEKKPGIITAINPKGIREKHLFFLAEKLSKDTGYTYLNFYNKDKRKVTIIEKINTKIKMAVQKDHVTLIVNISELDECPKETLQINIFNNDYMKNDNAVRKTILSCMKENNKLRIEFSEDKNNGDVNIYEVIFRDINIPVINIMLNPDRLANIYEQKSNDDETLSGIIAFINSLCYLEFDNNYEIAHFDNYDKAASTYPPINRIEISDERALELKMQENDYVNIINCKNGFVKRCVVKINPNVLSNEIRLTTNVREELNIKSHKPSKILLQKIQKAYSRNIVIQNIKDIKAGRIGVSNDIYSVLREKSDLIEVSNSITGASMDITWDNIFKEENLKPGTIKLSRYHRMLLDMDLPDIIRDYHLKTYLNSDNLSEEEKKLLTDYYDKEKIIKENEYDKVEEIKGVLKKVDYYSLSIYPLQGYMRRVDIKPLKLIKDFFLKSMMGYSHQKLRCVRPYDTDEGSDVVRISPNMIKVLGVEEMDLVIIKYRGKKMRARVLAIDSLSMYKDVNILSKEVNINFVIGIPVHIRKELEMLNLDCTCEVERDMGYLFKKNLNLQFFSILAVILTVIQTFSATVTRLILISIFIPVAMYMTFSKERNKVSKKINSASKY